MTGSGGKGLLCLSELRHKVLSSSGESDEDSDDCQISTDKIPAGLLDSSAGLLDPSTLSAQSAPQVPQAADPAGSHNQSQGESSSEHGSFPQGEATRKRKRKISGREANRLCQWKDCKELQNLRLPRCDKFKEIFDAQVVKQDAAWQKVRDLQAAVEAADLEFIRTRALFQFQGDDGCKYQEATQLFEQRLDEFQDAIKTAELANYNVEVARENGYAAERRKADILLEAEERHDRILEREKRLASENLSDPNPSRRLRSVRTTLSTLKKKVFATWNVEVESRVIQPPDEEPEDGIGDRTQRRQDAHANLVNKALRDLKVPRYTAQARALLKHRVRAFLRYLAMELDHDSPTGLFQLVDGRSQLKKNLQLLFQDFPNMPGGLKAAVEPLKRQVIKLNCSLQGKIRKDGVRRVNLLLAYFTAELLSLIRKLAQIDFIKTVDQDWLLDMFEELNVDFALGRQGGKNTPEHFPKLFIEFWVKSNQYTELVERTHSNVNDVDEGVDQAQ